MPEYRKKLIEVTLSPEAGQDGSLGGRPITYLGSDG
jgi:hypothetical protein